MTSVAPTQQQTEASAAAIERAIAGVASGADGSLDYADAVGRIVAGTMLFIAEAGADDRELLRHVEDIDLFTMMVSSALLLVEAGPVAQPPADTQPSDFETRWRAVWVRLPAYARTPHAAGSIIARLVYDAADDAGEAGVVVTVLLRRLAAEIGMGYR